MKGKTIRLYLTDGVPIGVLTAEILNWTGKVNVAPRSKLADLAARPEARRTGVYCLVGPHPESIGKDCVFTEDVPFNSPSAVATVVAAANCNGRANWRISGTSQTYADWQEAKLETATRATGTPLADA